MRMQLPLSEVSRQAYFVQWSAPCWVVPRPIQSQDRTNLGRQLQQRHILRRWLIVCCQDRFGSSMRLSPI